jgi:hypothetical protein
MTQSTTAPTPQAVPQTLLCVTPTVMPAVNMAAMYASESIALGLLADTMKQSLETGSSQA